MPENNDNAPRPVEADGQQRRGGPGLVLSILIVQLIIAAGAAVLWIIFNTEPEATRGGATRESAMLVDVTTVERGTHRPSVVATGTVRPARDIVLRPRVEGQVIDHASSLQPGGIVEADEQLIRLDPSDYRQTLRQRRSDLKQAQAGLRREQGRQRVAEREYELSDQQLTGANKDLVLRQPQLETAEAAVASARAAVDQAELELARTTINAPFQAQVLDRRVDVGSQVSAGDELARLVGIASYWVEVTVPVDKLRLLNIPSGDTEGAPVAIHNPGAWPVDVARDGRLFRLVGNLDDATRMARVLVRVEDPLARQASDKPRLLLGTFVEARIQARALDHVIRLDRDYLRTNDTVWVMDSNDELAIRDVTITARDSEHAYIRDGLEDGERIVTSSLATVREGAPLRRDGDDAGGANGEADDA
jgi:RND family efflux transporter MFP subunit